MSSTLLERVQTWILANDAASAARDAEIAEHGFEVNDERWNDVLALMPPVQKIAEGLVASAAEVERLRADLTTARRRLPPRYVAADGSILDPERCTPHAPDCAECGRGRAHDEGCLALLPTPAEEVVGLRAAVERLTAAIEEASLTLAAEQGRAEGAPSEGWTYGIIDDEGGRGWRKPWCHGMMFAWGIGCYVSSSAVVTHHPGGWSRWRYDDDGELDEEMEHHTDDAWTMRAAMLAADASK